MEPGLDRTSGTLLGRARESAEIESLLSGAVEGESGVLVMRGEAGSGKTALLDYAAAHAGDMQVLRVSGVESEADLAFAGLFGLVRPILSYVDDLPEHQSEALAGALGLAPSVGDDRFLISAAVLGLLATAADARPLLCLVDDAQWLDVPSADVLVFAARRLLADRVAMIFAARDGDARRFGAAGLPERQVRGLDDRSAEDLLDRCAPSAGRTVRARLLAEARGNPLALIELPAGLTEVQLGGGRPLPDTVPLTPRLQALFRSRVERLPESTQLALLAAAAEDAGELAIIARAAVELGVGIEALDPAEQASLISVADGAISFRHPLVRSAIYASAPLGERRRVHAALADALSGEEHADRRVWHQAMAALSADEAVASALEESAFRSRDRSAHASAATAFLRAAGLSETKQARARRLASAARASWDAGQADRSREAIAAALAEDEDEGEDEQRAELLYLKGIIDAHAGSVRDAPATLLQAAAATGDTSRRLEILQEAGEAAAYAGDMETVMAVNRQEAAIEPNDDRDRFMVAVGAGWVAAFSGDHQTAHSEFKDALRCADSLDEPRAMIWAADSASAGFGLGSGLRYANRAVELARAKGLLGLLPMALHRLALELIWNARFDLAYAAAQEGHRHAVELGHGTGVHLASMATVEALWGRAEAASTHAQEALGIGLHTGSSLLADSAQMTLGLLELTRGDAETATDRLLSLTDLDRPSAHIVIALHAVPDLVEAAVRANRAHEISEPVARYRAWAGSTRIAAANALLARCEALLGSRPGDEAFPEAIAGARSLSRFENARSELLYGEWLRREKRRREARAHLRTAVELFQSVGTTPWQDRAEGELRATGATTRKRDPSTLDDLTAQELQIAALVAQGLTNRDIAAQLFLSPRTIDYHLRKVFSKLGIASRRELVRDGLPSRHPGAAA